MTYANHSYSPMPAKYGADGDPRYPSPRKLRRSIAFFVDWILHLGIVGAIIVFAPHSALTLALAVLVVWPLVSFLHRTAFQGLFHATLGKLLCGLVIIRQQDGGWVQFSTLVRFWFRGFYITVLSLMSGGGEVDGWDPEFPSVVRRRDVKALAANGFRVQ
ncbi:RDD family protein [Nocardia huaxiensis]|uniref:RDD family protein n=1 Tax=Nocardia huaxiensis TaxID=2755382 RepID=A0A7D6ZC55_9NOCA|nr:RDD family protein [Nocardia huaxiensis]QLY31908.1 RDD family protein [Nocardia huaxiensis]